MNAARNEKTIFLVKVTHKILRDTISLKIHSHDICVSALIIFILLMISSPLNNNLSGFSINNSLALPSVFVLDLFLRDLDKSSIIKFILISYLNLSFLLSFKLLTLLKGFCLLVFSQEGSRSLIFKDAGEFGAVSSDSGDI